MGGPRFLPSTTKRRKGSLRSCPCTANINGLKVFTPSRVALFCISMLKTTLFHKRNLHFPQAITLSHLLFHWPVFPFSPSTASSSTMTGPRVSSSTHSPSELVLSLPSTMPLKLMLQAFHCSPDLYLKLPTYSNCPLYRPAQTPHMPHAIVLKTSPHRAYILVHGTSPRPQSPRWNGTLINILPSKVFLDSLQSPFLTNSL